MQNLGIENEVSWEYITPEKVQEYLEKGMDVNMRVANGWTPLHCVAWSNPNPEVIKVLVQAGADVHAQTQDENNNKTPLHLAMRNNSYVIKALVEAGSDVNALGDGGTPLNCLFGGNKKDIVFKSVKHLRESLDAKLSDMNFLGGGGIQAPFGFGWEFQKYTEIKSVKILLDAGADVNSRDSYGDTPLHIAGTCTDSNIITTLLNAGAEINAKNNAGWTPLHYAALSENLEVLMALLQAGAEVNIKNIEGKTPFDFAENKLLLLHTEAYQMLADSTYKSPAKKLKEWFKEKTTYTPLMQVSVLEYPPCKDWLNLYDGFWKLIDVKLAKECIELGADIQAWDDDGRTPLHHAAMGDGIDKTKISNVIIFLLEEGADCKVKDKHGKIPFDYAKENKWLKGSNGYWVLQVASRELKG